MKRKRGAGRKRGPAYKRRRLNVRKRIKRFKRNTLSMKANYSGFPNNRIVRIRYAERIPMAPTVGFSSTFHNMRANSCFDPNATGTGHQPLGFDQYSIFYNHYVVLGSKITVRWIAENPDSNDRNAILCGVKLTDDPTSIAPSGSNFDNLSERGMSYRIMIPNDQNVMTVRTGAKFSAKKFFNVKDVKDNVPRLGAAVTGNPPEEALYQLWFCSANDAAVSGVIMQAFVTIDYIVQFSEPKDIPQS